MDKFIVSARKYRPQTFDTVVGQAHITTTLLNAINNNHLAHAFLFCGPRGVGKTTCARILAKTINCENRQPSGEACDTCNSCRSFNDGASLNIHELDAASNNSVDDIRSLVEQVRFAPQAGKYKVYIVDEVHMLSSSAFNAFLKTLEEPPSYAIFILATTEKHKILPTILSRCQIFDFKRITTNDTVEHLQQIVAKEHIDADKASLQVIAQKSEGCMRDALSILDKIVSFTNGKVTYQNTLENLNILDEDYYFKMVDALMQQDLANALLLFDEINKKGFEGELVMNAFAEFIRNLLVCKDEKAAKLLDVVEGMEERYLQVAQKVDIAFLISSLNLLNEAEINYKMARNKRLHVEMVLIKLNFLQQAIELSEKDGKLVQKKILNSNVAYKLKPVKSIQTIHDTTTKSTGKLYIATTNESNKKTEIPSAVPVEKQAEKLIEPVNTPTIKPINSTGEKKNLLDILREKYSETHTIEVIKEAELLSMEKLQQCLDTYIIELEKQGGKQSSVSTFKSVKVSIDDSINFTLTVQSMIQQKFIELERTLFTDLIFNSFNNRGIRFKIVVEEQAQEEVSPNLSLNSRQRFEKMAERYPLLWDLKNRLRLEIDY